MGAIARDMMVAGRERCDDPCFMETVLPTFDLVSSGTIVFTDSHAFSRASWPLGCVSRDKSRCLRDAFPGRQPQAQPRSSPLTLVISLFIFPYLCLSCLRQTSRSYSTAQTYKIPQIFRHHQQLQVSERLTAHSVVTFARSSTRLP